MTAFVAATQALDDGDHEIAAASYRAVLESAPDFTPALRRLSGALMRLGRHKEAISLAERAVEMQHSPANLTHMATLLTFPGDNLPDPDARTLSRAKALVAEAARGDPDYMDAATLWGHIAIVTNSYSELEEAVGILMTRHQGAALTDSRRSAM